MLSHFLSWWYLYYIRSGRIHNAIGHIGNRSIHMGLRIILYSLPRVSACLVTFRERRDLVNYWHPPFLSKNTGLYENRTGSVPPFTVSKLLNHTTQVHTTHEHHDSGLLYALGLLCVLRYNYKDLTRAARKGFTRLYRGNINLEAKTGLYNAILWWISYQERCFISFWHKYEKEAWLFLLSIIIIVRRAVITNPEKLFGYPKGISESCLGFHKRTISDLRARVCTRFHLIFENVSDFSRQCFRYFGYTFGYPKSFSDLIWRLALVKYQKWRHDTHWRVIRLLLCLNFLWRIFLIHNSCVWW